ncbi:phosphoribosyl transferase [Pseudarthrobacter psychrotolerans]|uniref:Phosphoribosyl transferase n=1 Tax=Pseudarthrobacter psychrotolerans TaxID=2697569 RepID=A0A6P1NGU3_9MICC|nr:phosphoribosyltransferase family protein [Pseudarthrobacter psychrotolerans]QHK19506.1 phosphoribosyl transferase [Pseudarthrobacter psychrotolerans]
MSTRFEDRTEAGERLAAVLTQFRERPDTIVLGLARGGIPVAAAAAKALYLPLGAVLVRKLGIPGHDETAFGALAWSGGRIVRLLNRPLITRILDHGVRQQWLDEVEKRERAELLRRAGTYPGISNNLTGKTVLLLDDGLATGATMRAAVEAARSGGAARVVAAAPVGSVEAYAAVSRVCDAVLCLHLPGKFRAVGSFYRHFEQLTDEDAISLLNQ